MSPFPNQRVIPHGYVEHHRPTSEDAMNSTCVIYPSAAGPAPYKGAAAAAPAAVYDGPCNVERAAGGGQAFQADQPQSLTEYVVTLPVNAAPELRVGERGHLLQLTAASDPGLVGRVLRAAAVEYGSNVFERVLRCTDNQTQNVDPTPTFAEIDQAYTGATLTEFDTDLQQ